MKNLKKSIVVTLILSILLSFTVFAETVIPFEGEGTEKSPYLIGTAEEMYRFAEIVNGGYSFDGEYIKLTSDITLNDISNVENWSTEAPENEWTPIGYDDSVAFRGTFDGDNHTISGVYINSDKSFQALFGWMFGGAIRNVVLSDSYIKGEYTVAGIVALQGCYDLYNNGVNTEPAVIENCVNNATIVSEMSAGGVVADGMIVKNCINNGNVYSESDYVGGVAGGTHIIENCVNNGDVTGKERVAGVCVAAYCWEGHNFKLYVSGCTNNGTVRYEKNGYAITDVSMCKNVIGCVNNGEMIYVPPKPPEVHVHSYTVKEVRQPSCSSQGYTIYVCECGHRYNDDYVPALPHTPVDIGLKAPTCTKPGWKDGTKCTVCNSIISSAGIIPETGHSAEWVTVTAAQAGVDGLQQLKCTVCGEVLEEKVIPAAKKGDMNGDGSITAIDARQILRYSAKLDSGWDSPEIIAFADFDNDGKLTAVDARKCLRYAAQIDDYFKDFGVNIK